MLFAYLELWNRVHCTKFTLLTLEHSLNPLCALGHIRSLPETATATCSLPSSSALHSWLPSPHLFFNYPLPGLLNTIEFSYETPLLLSLYLQATDEVKWARCDIRLCFCNVCLEQGRKFSFFSLEQVQRLRYSAAQPPGTNYWVLAAIRKD